MPLLFLVTLGCSRGTGMASDSSTDDTGALGPYDSGAGDTEGEVVETQDGRLVITEIWADDGGGAFEVFNPAAEALNLNGLSWTDDIEDPSAEDVFTVTEDVWVAAGGYAVFCEEALTLSNDAPVVVWGGTGDLSLEDQGDQIRIVAGWSSGNPTTIDLVDFNLFGWPAESQNNTYQLKTIAQDATNNDAADSWCPQSRTPTLGQANAADDPC